MIIIKRIYLVLMIVFLATQLTAAEETTKAGTAAAQFLKIGVGARAQALGGAFVGITGDVNAIYWNPANIAAVDQVSWTGTHTRWFADITHQFTALVIPMGDVSALGFSATLVSMDDEEITTIEEPTGTGLFWSAQDIAVGISYARKITDRFSIGVTGKYVYQQLHNETASTVALDVGSSLYTGFKGITIGMSFTNFGGDLKLSGRDLIRAYDPNPANSRNDDVDTRLHTEPWPLPVNFRVGIVMEIVGTNEDNFFNSNNHRVLLAMDANHPNDAAENLRGGLEYELYKMFSLRGGYVLNEGLVDFTFGMGLNVNIGRTAFLFNYALASYGDLENVNYLTFGLEF